MIETGELREPFWGQFTLRALADPGGPLEKGDLGMSLTTQHMMALLEHLRVDTTTFLVQDLAETAEILGPAFAKLAQEEQLFHLCEARLRQLVRAQGIIAPYVVHPPVVEIDPPT